MPMGSYPCCKTILTASMAYITRSENPEVFISLRRTAIRHTHILRRVKLVCANVANISNSHFIEVDGYMRNVRSMYKLYGSQGLWLLRC
jgi:hypothetical protein